MRVGYQGVNGTFSEIAVNQYFKNQDFFSVNYKDFKNILNDVENGLIDYALIPIENTTTGIISRTYDLFKNYNIYVVGEINIKIEEQLLGIKGATLKDIKEIYSHPEALGQCSTFFGQNPNIKSIAFQDTAKSAEYVKNADDKSKAALASVLAKDYYGLEIIKENVQDNQNNVTRFFCISNKPEYSINANKISTMFILKHEVGSLFKLLELFYKNNINLLKLESRPIQGRLFEYCFYLDFDGNINEDKVKEVFSRIDEYCISYRLLGCYERANI